MINEFNLLKQKIYNTIILNYTKEDTYVVNQEGKLFECPTPYKNIGEYRGYIFGGIVNVFNQNYHGTFSFDFNAITENKRFLSFCSFEDESGKCFYDFYLKIMHGKTENFTWVNNLIAYDIKSQIKQIRNVEILNTKVDEYLTKQICSLFPSLTTIEFQNCIIGENCQFISLQNLKINFKDCVIKNSSCLSNSKNDFNFIRCQFNEICNNIISGHTNYSKHITMFECNIDFYSLFLKTNFSELEGLSISYIPDYDGEGNNFFPNLGKGFTFLPDSCPYLNSLRIEGTLDNLDFLVKMPYLEKVSILSSCGVMDYPLLRINNRDALKKLETKNYTRIKIKQILHANLDEEYLEYYATESELERIVYLNAFYRIFHVTKEEELAFKNYANHYANLIFYLLDDNFIKLDGYYENYYNQLIFKRPEKNSSFLVDKIRKLKYQYKTLFYDEDKNKIVLGKKCLFYIDGYPIIFRKDRIYRPIKSELEAVNFREQHPISPYKKEDMTKDYLEQLKEVVKMNEEHGITDISVGEFINAMQVMSLDISLSLVYKDLLKRLSSGHEIIYKLYKENEKLQYIMHLRKVNQKCLKAYANMINRNFSKFTKEELVVISKNLFSELSYKKEGNIDYNPYFVINDLPLDEDKLINSINQKCNGNYSKLIQSIHSLRYLEDHFVKKETIITKEEQVQIKTLSLKTKNTFLSTE